MPFLQAYSAWQTDSIVVCTETCCSHLLREPSPEPPCHGHSLCSSQKMASLVGQFGMCFLQAHSFRKLKIVIFQDCCSVFNNLILKVALKK